MLVLFAGPCEAESHLPGHLRRAGCDVSAIDTKLGGAAHDVLRAGVGGELLSLVQSAHFDAVFIATPCSSYSVLHEPTLRSDSEPEGIQPVPPEWAAYLAKHNALADFTALALDACRASGTPVAVENPAARSLPDSPASWPEHSDHGSLWHMPCIATALGALSATFHTCAQCAFAAPHQKWTTFAAAGHMSRTLAGLGERRYWCHHGKEGHSEVLVGRDELGHSRAGKAAAYPRQLNELLADALVSAASARYAEHTPRRTPLGSPGSRAPAEGYVADGPALGRIGHAACEAARALPHRFAHPGHLSEAPREDLLSEPFPGDLASPVTSLRPKGVCAARRRRPLPRAASACARVGCCADPWPAQPDPPKPPPIAIDQLFLGDVYATQVQSWFALADEAAAAIRSGTRPPTVPTRVIGQDSLQPWARDIVWDCREPANCRPVRRSTRRTTFAGARQVDRAALRRIAAELNWHDDDLVDQIGEGGMEVRSACTLDIVLTFHHQSLVDEIDLASKTVADHIREEWVAPPTRHLPFVPCRLQPRGVVMQPRTRLLADGVTLEEYEKPRITSDSSFGGVDSVNGGVPDGERSVILPSIQSLGRGWAICHAAFSEDSASPCPANPPPAQPVAGYCIDAESAYSFCPIQEADLWTQCFCWWDSEGAAGAAVDRRMGFGGSFAPNRFERLSTLVAAYAQHLQGQFDDEQPPPQAARRFTASRRALQRLGRLPPGQAQCHPRYLQVFVDDFTGVAGTDIVVVPPSVSHIHVADEHMRAGGCTPAAPASRVHVHARLTILALERVGLYAAPHKVAIGSPLPALGFLVDGSAKRLRCPHGKQRAILADIATQDAAAAGGDVDRRRARRLVGRLCHLAQVEPSIRQHLHSGHTVAEATWPGRGGAPGKGHLRLAIGGAAHTGWRALLRTAHSAISANIGVSAAPRLTFPARHAPGSATCFTDASGEDGFGGYAFVAGRPCEVFILSEVWPHYAAAALAASSDVGQAAERRRDGSAADAYLPMPAAELFAQVAMPRALARVAHFDAVFAVGDCEPSGRVVESLHSGNPIMRPLAQAARSAPWSWANAHVPREANTDADRLSHPAQLRHVLADAEAAQLRTHVLELQAEDWELLQEAVLASRSFAPSRKRPAPPSYAPAPED